MVNVYALKTSISINILAYAALTIVKTVVMDIVINVTQVYILTLMVNVPQIVLKAITNLINFHQVV